jgi:hypothetical protein
MSEFSLPLSIRDRGWLELRERLVRAARNIHFVAVSSNATNGAKLLVVSGNLADLAMSIPMSPEPGMSRTLVGASTLIALQDLQHEADNDDVPTPGR